MKRLFPVFLLLVSCMTENHTQFMQNRRVNLQLSWEFDANPVLKAQVRQFMLEFLHGTQTSIVTGSKKHWTTIHFLPGEPKKLTKLGKLRCFSSYGDIGSPAVFCGFMKSWMTQYGIYSPVNYAKMLAFAAVHEYGHSVNLAHKPSECCIMSSPVYIDMALGRVPPKWD